MNHLRVGLIGAGTMGALHARVVATSDLASLVWVQDRHAHAAATVADRFGAAAVTAPDLERVDAVVVAVSTEHHYDVVTEVLEAGLPVLVEKPLAHEHSEVLDLLALSDKLGVPIMCGLLERFNPAVRTAFELCRDPLHFRSVRHSPAAHRITTDVAGDLLIHDVDLAIRLFGEPPEYVMALCDSRPRHDGPPPEIAEALLRFGSEAVASVSASRRSQRKVRSISIADTDRLIEIDLLRQDVTIYRHVLESASLDDQGYRQQTIIDIPVLKYHGEPLALQLQHFVSLVRGDVDADAERASIRAPHDVIADVLVQAAGTP